MSSGAPNAARRVLVRGGRALPFILCSLVAVSYMEELYALVMDKYVMNEGYMYLDTPLTCEMAKYVKYDLVSVVVTLIISVSIEACKWNMFAVLYLGVNLLEKYVFTFEFDTWGAYTFLTANMLISVFLVYKGCCLFLKTFN